MSKLLIKEEQQVAIALARNTLETALGLVDEKSLLSPSPFEGEGGGDVFNFNNKPLSFSPLRKGREMSHDKNPMVYKKFTIFAEKRGVFVTLHQNGELHGCIGLIEPIKPLGEAIKEMALAAAFDDYRFSPITTKEWPKIKIEISVLTVPEKINNIQQIQLGKHGVIIKSGLHSGVFLPQVATETGWSLEEFMDELCSQKAGLPKDCWRHGRSEIYIFEAQVFSE